VYQISDILSTAKVGQRRKILTAKDAFFRPATQYVRDVDLEGFQDARLAPLGPIEQDDLAKWTANFVRP
jgi:hypothetical protein